MSNTNAIGRIVGDYVVIEKVNEKKSRSKYKLKCLVCGSILETYNIPKEKKHSEHCSSFCEFLLGVKIEDYMITKAYREDRTYVDLICLKCGAVRIRVAYRDFKVSFKNKHGKHCTIYNSSKFKNKQLVKKLTRTFANIKTRLFNKNKSSEAYLNLTTDFLDTVDFISTMYPLYEERLKEGHELSELSTDRIDTTLGYLKNNVRCLTLSEQQKNKRNTRLYFIDGIEYRNIRLFCKELNISEREFYGFYDESSHRNELTVGCKKAVVLKLYDVETIE